MSSGIDCLRQGSGEAVLQDIVPYPGGAFAALYSGADGVEIRVSWGPQETVPRSGCFAVRFYLRDPRAKLFSFGFSP